MLVLMLYCCHLEILNNLKTRDTHVYFALGPINYVASPSDMCHLYLYLIGQNWPSGLSPEAFTGKGNEAPITGLD